MYQPRHTLLLRGVVRASPPRRSGYRSGAGIRTVRGTGRVPVLRAVKVASASVTSTASGPRLQVRPIPAADHLAFLDSPLGRRRPASFLQTPAWGAVKSEWRHESLGWFDPAGTLVGVGPGALPAAAEAPALPGLPARGTASSTGPTTTSTPGWTRSVDHLRVAGRVRRPDGPAGRHCAAGARRRSRRASPTADVRAARRPAPAEPATRPVPGWSPSCASSAGARRRSRGASRPGSRSTTSGSPWPTRTAYPAPRPTCWPG